MNIDEEKEINLLDIDWSTMSKKDKNDVITYHIKFIDISRKVVGASSAYNTNFYSLFVMLLIVMSMSLLKFDNRTTILTVLGFQFIKTLASRLFEVSLLSVLSAVRKEMIQFISGKIR